MNELERAMAEGLLLLLEDARALTPRRECDSAMKKEDFFWNILLPSQVGMTTPS